MALQQVGHLGALRIIIDACHGIREIDARFDHAWNSFDRLLEVLRAMRAGHAANRQLDMVERLIYRPRPGCASNRCSIDQLVHASHSFIWRTAARRCAGRSRLLVHPIENWQFTDLRRVDP
jgi:hypothetical protein